MVFTIPIAYITNETAVLTVDVKNFSDYDVVELKRLIQNYIEENGIHSNVKDLYNKLYEELDYPFIFKPRDKELLAGNNIHIQILPKFDKCKCKCSCKKQNNDTKEDVYDESVGRVKWIGSFVVSGRAFDYSIIPHYYIAREKETGDIYLFRTYEQMINKIKEGEV